MTLNASRLKQMVRIVALLFIIFVLSASTLFKIPAFAAEPQAVYYISPQGNDSNPGTKDAPFKTITKARDVVRTVNKNMTGDIIVYLREGSYNLTDTVTFTPEDSGTNGYTIHYRAYPKETPVIMAAEKVTGWMQYDGDIYRAPLSRSAKLRSLYVNEKRAYMASRTITCQGGWGEYTVTGGSAPWAWDSGTQSDGIKYRGEDFPASPRNPSDIESESGSTWNKAIVCFREVTTDGGDRILKLQQPYGSIAQRVDSGAAFQTGYGASHKVSNVFEFLDTPGEFYFDRSEGYVYYYKESDEDMSAASVYAPNGLETLFDISGSSTSDRVERLTFYGLTFKYSDWNLKEIDGSYGKANLQGAAVQVAYEQGKYQNGFMRRDDVCPAAICVNNSDTIVFERNTLAHTGAEGISMVNDVRNSSLTGNAIYDIAGSAILISHPQHVFIGDGGPREKYAPGIEGACSNIDVKNNFVNQTTRLFKGHAAVMAYYPDTLTFSNNLVNDTAYNGLSMGFGWWEFDGVDRWGAVTPGNPSTTMKNNTVADNWVFNTMQELADSGPIYTLGSQPDTTISGNYMRGVPAGHKYGLHPDEGSAYITNINNVIDTDLGVDDTVEVGTWGYQHDLHYINNYTTKGTYHDTNVPNSTFEPFHKYPDAVWPIEAYEICVNAGIEEEYQDIIPSAFMGLQDIIFPASLKAAGGMSIPIKSTRDETDTVWLAPSGTTEFREGFTMKTAKGTDGTIEIPKADGKYKLYIVSKDGTTSPESQATLTVIPEANRLLPESIPKVKPGKKIAFTESLKDADVYIWAAPDQTKEGEFDENSLGMSRVPGDSSTIHLPVIEGKYYIYILSADGKILSKSDTHIYVSSKYLVRDVIWAGDPAIEDRRGANGSVETNNRFGELQNYNPNTIGLFFEEGIKEIGGLTQLNALDNRGGDWAGYININVDVPKTDTYELSFLTIGGSGRKLEATIDGVSTGIFDVINDKSSPHAYSTGDVLNVFQLEVLLDKGNHVVKLQAPKDYEAPNFIAMAVAADADPITGGISVDTILVRAGKDTIQVGEKLQMTAAVLPSYAEKKGVSWSTEDQTVTIDQNGLVTGAAAGRATIRATAKDGSGITGLKTITIEKAAITTKTHTVTLDGNGGTVTQSQLTREDGKPIGVLPTPARAGYEFTGWYTSRTGDVRISADTQVKESFTIYAQWRAIPKPPVSPSKGFRFNYKGLRYAVAKPALSGRNGIVQVTGSVSKKVKSVSIPARIKRGTFTFSVESIAPNAFKNRTKLKKLVIGSNVKRIGKNAFYNNKSLKSIVIKSKKIKFIGKNAFKNIYKKARIKVPASKIRTYKKLLKGKGQKKTVKIVK